jgi:hypothetical protein
MKHRLFTSLVAVSMFACLSCRQTVKIESPEGPAVSSHSDSFPSALQKLKGSFNFLVVSDWGWNGKKYQQAVADQMSRIGDGLDIEYIVSCGDNFQVNGVASVDDPLWLTNFENVYTGVSMLENWYPVLGNHDYRGNTAAQIDYSRKSRRWRMTDRYYSISSEINDSVSAKLIFIDTSPLIFSYHKRWDKYPDIARQDTARQMRWLEKELSESKGNWIFVFGHHPVYSASSKHGNTEEMIKKIKPLLEKFDADAYFCGHDHDFQHLREKGRKLDYFVTGTGGDTRPANSNEMSLFSRSEPGFSIVSLKGDSLSVSFININGEVIYSFAKKYN